MQTVCGPVVSGSQHFDEKQDPGPNPEPRQSDKSDPDPHQNETLDSDPHYNVKRDPDLDPRIHNPGVESKD